MYPKNEIIRAGKEIGMSDLVLKKLFKNLEQVDESEKVIQTNLKKVLPRLK